MMINHLRFTTACVGLFLAGAANAEVVMVRGEALTQTEIGILPPVCKLILVEKPQSHVDYIGQRQNAALFDRPEYHMAKNAYHLHHWCWATVSKARYFRASSSRNGYAYKMLFHDDIDYVIRNMRSDWQYMPLMHTEKGEMYIWDKNYAGAFTEAQKALSLNPKFAKAHALSVTAYKGMNQTDKALAAATEGLKHNPESRSLKRLYVETGGKPPYPEPYEKPQEPETVSAEPPPTEKKSAVDSTAEGTQLIPTTPANPVVPESIQKANPYCRFCPE